MKRKSKLTPFFRQLSVLDSAAESWIDSCPNPNLKRLFRRSMEHADAEPLSVFTANELTQIMTQAYERKYPKLKAKELIPIKPGMNPGAMAWSFDRWDQVGEADFVGGNATDLNRVDVSRDRETNPIRMIAVSYGYTIEELLAAQFAGVPLDQRKANAAMRAMAVKENAILLYGDASRQIPGFLTESRIPQIILPNGGWTTATSADNLLADMNVVANAVYVTSQENHEPNTLVMGLDDYNIVSQKPRSTTSDTTVLEYFLRTSPFIRDIRPLREMASIPGYTRRAIMAFERDPENLEGIVSLPAQQQAPQTRALETVVPVLGKQGGTVWYFPFAAAIGLL